MSNYTKTTNFAAKDSLPSGNAAKIVKGAEIDTEFNNIATASATKANANNAALTGTTVFETLSDGTIGVTGWVDEDNMSSDSAVLIPTQQSVKAYVDSQVTAQDLDVTDGSNSIDIDLDSESLGILGGTGIDSTASGTGVTLAIDSTVTTLTGTQTLSNKTLTTPVISGALTTNSTIDGRDVAVDGSKLDGIEASADVTDTTNVTAAGALMDSEVTNLAQVKAFDSSDYATAAQGTTADAALPKAGGAMTGAITTNSTFDGRDVATDGTKLDGIEASADVTDTANVTAAGALMDSELTNITAVKALNQGVATGDSPTFAGVTSPLFISDDIDFVNSPTSQIAVQIDTINSRLGIKSGSPDVTLDMQGAVDSIALPAGTTAQRPTGAAGMFRYNSTLEQFEGYTDAWGAIGGGGGSNLVSDTMTGDGSDTTLTLSNDPLNENNTQVYIDGVYQNKDTYSVSGTTLTFSTAPPNGSAVEAMTIQPTAVNVPADASVTSAKLSGDLTTPGALTVTGAFTSLGIDDNATSTAITIDSSENVGIGNSNPSAFNSLGATDKLVIGDSTDSNLTLFGTTYGSLAFADSDTSSSTAQYAGLIQYYHADNSMQFYTGSDERMRIDSSGNLTTRQSTGNNFRVIRNGDNSIEVGNYNATDGYQNTSYSSNTHTFYAGTAGAGSVSRAVDIDASGNVGIGATTYEGSVTSNASSVWINPAGYISANINNDWGLGVNRTGTDGTLINLRKNGADVGDISVSSGVVSYNAFMGSHYSETVDTDLLFGTVMEVTGELVDQNFIAQERLSKVKVSDTAESKNVYGVWIGGYDGGGETVAALGASWCRVASGVTLELGDLLVSNGDGTAKVQSDDIIRSMTIGKVTSTTVKENHTDGSYVVPVVLYCG